MVERFAKKVCSILNIKMPRIVYDDSVFVTETTLAQCSSDGKEIYLRKKDISADYLFGIAHELRHIWQIRTLPEILKDYQTADELSVEKYNMQASELDANAFAAIIMEQAFGVSPTFECMPNSVKRAIWEQKQNIFQSLYETHIFN